MTETDRDPCRVMAEQMFDRLDAVPIGDETPELLERIIRNHTIVPEMVEFIDDYYNLVLDASEGNLRAKAILTKAKGMK